MRVKLLFLLRIGGIALSMAVGAIFARDMEPDGYGRYVFFLSATGLASMMAVLGGNGLIIQQASSEAYAAHSVFLRLRGQVFSGALLCGAVVYGIERNFFFSMLIMGAVFLTAIVSLLDAVSIAIGKTIEVIVSSFFIKSLGGLFFYYVLNFIFEKYYQPDKYLSAVASYTATSVVQCIYFYCTAMKDYKYINSNKIKFSLYERLQMFLVSLTSYLTQNLDQFVLALVVGNYSVAQYKVGWLVASAVIFVRPVLESDATRKFGVAIRANNKIALRKIYFDTVTKGLIVGAFFAILIYAFGELAINLVYGEKYRDGLYVAYVLTAGFISMLAAGASGNLLVIWQKQIILIYAQIGHIVFVIIGGIFLVQNFGVIGMSFSVVIGMVFSSVFQLTYVRRHLAD